MASLLCININCININYSCSEGNNSPSSFFPCSLLVSFLPRRRTKLNAVDLRDQVGSYRVIVSYETELLEAFSLCILQQHNCFNCDAKILTRPNVVSYPPTY